MGTMSFTKDDITELLNKWSDGDLEARDRLMPLIFDEARAVAHRVLAGEDPDLTLQSSDLFHEVYLRLTERRTVQWKNRAHFFASLAQLMRRLLVDHARRKRRPKHGGQNKVPLDEAMRFTDAPQPDLMALDSVLGNLEKIDPRQHQVVMLRYFVGLTQEEVADVLGVARATVERDWKIAKMWLRQELSDDS